MKTLEQYKLNRHRYYLHGKLRKVLRINTLSKTISVTDEKYEALTPTQKKLLYELKAINYQVQYEIE